MWSSWLRQQPAPQNNRVRKNSSASEEPTEAPEDTSDSSTSEDQTGSSQLLAKDNNAYKKISDNTGALTVEVPYRWEVLTGEDSEQGAGWLSATGESAATSITTSSDLYAWHYTSGVPGMYIVASRGLAQTYTNDQLLTTDLNDYSSSCELGTLQDFERSPFMGKVQPWKNCGGNGEVSFLTVAAAPEDRECVVTAQISMYSEADVKAGEHILDTLQVDCDKVPQSAAQEDVPAVPAAPALAPPAPVATEPEPQAPTPSGITPEQAENRRILAEREADYDGTGPSPWVQGQIDHAAQSQKANKGQGEGANMCGIAPDATLYGQPC